MNRAADVLVPLLQVTVGAGVNRGFGERLETRGQHQFLLRRFGLGMDNGNSRNRQCLSFVGESLALAETRQQTNDSNDGKQNAQGNGDQIATVLSWARRLRTTGAAGL